MSDATPAVKARECRFAIHVPSYHPDIPDVHVVKEKIHYADGTTKPYLRLHEDYKRPFWITVPNKRDHQQKKEWEEIDNLMVRHVTQSELRGAVARAIDQGWSKDPLKKLLRSPYIYGADISSSSLLKSEYFKKWPNLFTPFSRCIFDTETDVVNGTEEIIMATAIFDKEIFIVARQDFLEGITDVEERLQATSQRLIGEHLQQYGMKIELYVAKDLLELVKVIFARIHQWMPDWLAIWNMDFDVNKVLDALKKYDVDPKTVLCDPNIPEQFRKCKYVPGPDRQETASGKVKPINPAARWHTLHLTASFYVIDAMCSYKHLRLGEQEEPSYSLNAILTKILNLTKLKFDQTSHLEGLAWHKEMQSKFKIEYMVYNIFDCLSMLVLDDKLKDLAFTLPSFAATTDFEKFKSNPRKITDALHFYVLERGFVMGTTGHTERTEYVETFSGDEEEEDDDEDEDDDAAKRKDDVDDGTEEDEDDDEEEPVAKPRQTLSLKNWILTLKAHLSVLGLPLIDEDTSMRTNIRTHVYDSDATSAYPSATIVANVSMTTTKREIIDVVGIPETMFRRQNMNLMLGSVNAIEYGTTMFKFPKPEDLLTQFIADHS